MLSLAYVVDPRYDMALFHQSFARVLTAVKAKKAKEEQFRRDALKGLHKLKTGAGQEKSAELFWVIISSKSSRGNFSKKDDSLD